ncbi:MAG TPA: methylated-DNA--[protein]-cysteine S-methyltransferase [Polyangia bacterium]|nr:methylated-DNA--[protein]-cysteine S-methyltransferase [Polyangia bacterium]
MSDTTFFTTMPSPAGRLTLVGSGDHLLGLYFDGDSRAPAAEADGCLRDDLRLRPAVVQMEEYFAGRRTRFDLSLAPQGTPFQRQVWQALQAIPYGETTSYGELARAIGRPGAFRAVGGANNRNPIAIVIPCHRVIGADGSMTGYGGGLPNKHLLLALEAKVGAAPRFAAAR